MNEMWRDTTLGDLISLQRGHDLPARERRMGNIPVVGSGGITGWHDEAKVSGPGISIGRAANLGEPTLSEGPYWPLNTTLYVTDFRGNDPYFVYYLFKSLDLTGFNSGSVQPMLNRNYIANVPVRVPAPTEQRRVGLVLRNLDRLMTCSRTVADAADSLLIARVSRDLDRSGAQSGALSSMSRFVNGRAYTKGATGTGRMVVRIAELSGGPGASTVYNDISVPEQHLVRPGDLLFAWSGSLTVSRWFRDEAIVNQHIFKVVPEPEVPDWLVYVHLKRMLAYFKSLAADKATTMGHIQRKHLDVHVPVLDAIALAEVRATCEALWTLALQAERRLATLEDLRTALMRGLLHGDLRIREAAA